jgi:hypothetical protein
MDNLIKTVESRIRSAAGRRMLVGAAVVSTVMTVLIFLFAGISAMRTGNGLKRTRHELEQVRPGAAKLRDAQQADAANRKMLSEFQHWSTQSGLPMYKTMRAVQEDIPEQMVLYHFSAGLGVDDEKDAVVCSLYLSGSARDELTAIDVKQRLNHDARLRRFCGEVKLVSTKRYSVDGWAFALEGRRSSGDAE